jgi:hypothetical protein
MRATRCAAFWMLALTWAIVPALRAGEPPKPPAKPADPPRARVTIDLDIHDPRPLVTVSKKTTHILAPLRSDGYVDYAAAWNEVAGKGVVPENNAAVLLWKAVGPENISSEARRPYFAELGMRPPPEEGRYLNRYAMYCAELKGEDRDNNRDEDEDEANRDNPSEELRRATRQPWSKEGYPRLAGWLDANAQPLQRIVEASRRTQFYSPAWSEAEGVSEGISLESAAGFPYWMHRDAADALRARAMRCLHEGKVEQAWQDLLACHRLARLIGQSGRDWREARQIEEDVCISQRALAEHARLGAQRAAKCQADLQQLPLPGLTDRALLWDRWTCLSEVQQAILQVNALPGEMDAFTRTIVPLLIHVFVDWDLILRRANAHFDGLAEGLAKPTYSQRAAALSKLDEAMRRAEEKDEEEYSFLWDLLDGPSPRAVCSERLSRALISRPMRGAGDFARCEADAATQLQLTQLAFSLSAYRTDHGQYPPSLYALQPKYLDELPKDVYTGAGFIYKRTTSGYLLYSLGPNGKDDGATNLQDDRPPDQEFDPEADDIAVRVPSVTK